MKRTLIITGIVAGFIVIAMFVFNKLISKKNTEVIYTEVKRGPFEITVANSGDLEAEKSVEIKGPEILGSNRGRRRQPGWWPRLPCLPF